MKTYKRKKGGAKTLRRDRKGIKYMRTKRNKMAINAATAKKRRAELIQEKRKQIQYDLPIGIENKKDIKVQEELSELALIDSKHDFGTLADNLQSQITKLLPYKYTNAISEQLRGFEKLIGFNLLTTVQESINNKLIKNITNREYIIHGKNIENLPNGFTIIDMLRNGSNKEDENEFSFYIDFDLFGLLKKLKIDESNISEKYKDAHAYLVYSREGMCDPAGKTSMKSRPYLFNSDKGVKLTQLTDTISEPITYSKFNSEDKNILNDFCFKNFDIKIDKFNDELVQVYDGIYENTNYQYILSSVNYETSINTSKTYIEDESNPMFYRIIPFFQKRSGDWLQGLCSLQYLRNYDPSPSKGVNILVTHDQAFLAYALRIGAHVLFCQQEGGELKKSYIFFYNSSVSSDINPLDIFKIFFQNNRYTNAISLKNQLIEKYDNLIQKTTDNLNSLYNNIMTYFSITALNFSNFNTVYEKYHMTLFLRIYFKNIFSELEQYRNIDTSEPNLELDTQENLVNIKNRENFVINIESLNKKYNDTYFIKHIQNINTLKIDKTMSSFIGFNLAFSTEHISIELNHYSLKAYYHTILQKEPMYTRQLLDKLDDLRGSRYISKFFLLGIVSNQHGGKIKIENTLSKVELLDKLTKKMKNTNLEDKVYTEKEDAENSIKFLELILDDYNNYEAACVIKFKDAVNKHVRYDMSLHNYHMKFLANYLDTNEDNDIYVKFIKCIIEILYRNNKDTFDKVEVQTIFDSMREAETQINSISKIEDFNLQESCLAVARQLYTEEKYQQLMSNFPINL